MDFLWVFMECTTWVFHGQAMVISWKTYGKAMVISCLTHPFLNTDSGWGHKIDPIYLFYFYLFIYLFIQ